MRIEDLMGQPGSWLTSDSEPGVVVSSRIRLARNFHTVAFPGWAGQEELMRLCAALRELFRQIPRTSGLLCFEMGEVEPIDREVLKERHLISQELAERGAGSALVVSPDERIAIMINEEDHLRLQVLLPGMDLRGAWTAISAIDDDIEMRMRYAFSPQYGFLTACPSNVGTGLRASVMLHLPGLRLMNEIEQVVKGLNRTGFEVRGLWGEGSEAAGSMFQLSNRMTLGETESGTIDRISAMCEEVVRQEWNARGRLVEQAMRRVRDHVGRAMGILLNAHMISSNEVLDLISGLRLGVELGLTQGVSPDDLNRLLLLTQPGHLQKAAKRLLDPEERDEVRARIVRQELKDLVTVDM